MKINKRFRNGQTGLKNNQVELLKVKVLFLKNTMDS